MPANTRARSVRRAATKRTILGALDENGPTVQPIPVSKNASNDHFVKPTNSVSFSNNVVDTSSSMEGTSNSNSSSGGTIPKTPFEVPDGLDGTNLESVQILLQDLEKEVKRIEESIWIKAAMATKEQQEVYFLANMKLSRSMKNMTIQEFNEKFMSEGQDITQFLLDGTTMSSTDGSSTTWGANKKRVRTGLGNNNSGNGTNSMDLETPLRDVRSGRDMRTPGTLLRTAKRGETLYSHNGSPVDQTDEGGLVATVLKKRKGNETEETAPAALFDINVGEGRYVSLSDPSSIEHLDDEMKNSAMTQLKTLQDQMAKLMAQLGK